MRRRVEAKTEAEAIFTFLYHCASWRHRTIECHPDKIGETCALTVSILIDHLSIDDMERMPADVSYIKYNTEHHCWRPKASK